MGYAFFLQATTPFKIAVFKHSVLHPTSLITIHDYEHYLFRIVMNEPSEDDNSNQVGHMMVVNLWRR